MLYFHSWSGGKDSTASVILDHIHGLPPSKIIFSEVMFDRKREISGELPEHIDFVRNKAKPLFESWGYEVEIVRAEKDYLDLFYHVIQKSKVQERNGKYAGWLMGGKCYANRRLKTNPIHEYFKRLDLAGEAYTPYVPDEAEVEMLARVLWGEARGVPSDMEKAAVVWCVLNRVDAARWPDTVAGVVTEPSQFAGYSPDYPATEELKAIAADVLTRWERERREGGDVGRVLPAEYFFFTGDGERNYFRTEFTGGVFWDWTLPNPYSS